MKLIIAIIQPSKLEAVKEALSQVEVFRLTVMDAQRLRSTEGLHGDLSRSRVHWQSAAKSRVANRRQR